MKDNLVVLCTCPDRDQAGLIARSLVEQRLAACVQTVGPIESTYWWNDKVETANEILLLIKTTGARFEDVKGKIQALHTYEVPEIVALPIEAGSEQYLAWLGSQIGE